METISEISFRHFQKSEYVKTLTLFYKQNGIDRRWDMLELHDSVSIIIKNVSRNVYVLVKQFRPAVYCSTIPEAERHGSVDIDEHPPSLGVTIAFCAGKVDKKLPVLEIAREEVLEECGYDVPVTAMEKITSFHPNVGISGNVQTLYYCEVTDDMKVSNGGGVHEESIEVVEMTLEEMQQYMHRNEVLNSGANFLFGIHWILNNKVNK